MSELSPFDSIGSLEDSKGHIHTYWLRGRPPDASHLDYKLHLEVVDLISMKGWSATFDLKEAIDGNEEAEADPLEFVKWLEKGLERIGAHVMHTSSGLYVTAEMPDLGNYRFPPWREALGNDHEHAAGARPLSPEQLGALCQGLVQRLLEFKQQAAESERQISGLHAQVTELQGSLAEREKTLEELRSHPALKGVVQLRQLSRSFSQSKGEGGSRARHSGSQAALPSQQLASLASQAGAGPVSLTVNEMTQKGGGHVAEVGAPVRRQEEEDEGEQEPPRKVSRGSKPRVVPSRGGRSLFQRKR